ncbi:MAG: NADH-quinone oxidoreductase subunit L [Acidimicrobiia bacterium]|nr:NADH-quinone oxidoreductase subunit L [Acidimicrobiia bacterium]
MLAALGLFAAEEGEHAALTLSDGGVLAEWAWLIVVVPLVAAFAIIFFGKQMKNKGWELAVGALGFVGLYGVALFIANMGDGISFSDQIEIARIGDFAIEWGWVVDGLSITLYALVGVVGTAVFIYAKGYMEGEIRYTFFFGAFTFFAGSMLVLVSSPNLLQLIVGWEGVGLASYLLIGHYWEEKENSDAAIKAFMTNKIADVGLVIGVIIMGATVGSFRFGDVLEAAVTGDSALEEVAFWGGLALFIGAMGKSAQFPFHVWLPDAMAGPTPVSSLMHAATMVTAGVYLVGRMFPFYEDMGSDVRTIIIAVGVITLFSMGLIAMVQDDVKKVLAYSTLSQLGYMTAAMGAGAYTAAMFHLFTHAFFKGLLFLCAGSMIHAVHSNNMSDMGGLRRFMPTTYKTWLIGSLALAGIVPLSGFFSKDEILASLSHEGQTVALVIALAGAFITAFYMTRATALSFFGEFKGHGEPHESPSVMTRPLVGLAALAAVAGFANVPGLFTGFTDWVTSRAIPIVEHHAESFNFGLAGIGLAVGIAGIAAGWALYSRDEATQTARDRLEVPVLYPVLRNKYYMDDIYHHGLVRPIRDTAAAFVNWTNTYIIDGVVNGAALVSKFLAGIVYGGFDQHGIDFGINVAGAAAGEAGTALSYSQSGKVQQYAAALFVGVVLLVAGFIIFT